MDELEKLFADYKTGRTKYPQERAKAEDAFFRGVLDKIAKLESDIGREPFGQEMAEFLGPPLPHERVGEIMKEMAKRGPGRPPKVKTEEPATNG